MTQNTVPNSQRTPPRERPAKPTPPKQGGFFPPWWSILFTLLMVGFCAGSLVLVMVSLGGKSAPALPPQLRVLTAEPLPMAQQAAQPETVSAGSTIAFSAEMPSSFAMAGPTLPPPNITPTPMSIDIGRTVRVIGVGEQQLNVRERPGVIGVAVQFRAPDNTLFLVLQGPTHTDGLTWWQVQDISNNRTGWAASNYLEVVPELE